MSKFEKKYYPQNIKLIKKNFFFRKIKMLIIFNFATKIKNSLNTEYIKKINSA